MVVRERVGVKRAWEEGKGAFGGSGERDAGDDLVREDGGQYGGAGGLCVEGGGLERGRRASHVVGGWGKRKVKLNWCMMVNLGGGEEGKS